MPLAPGTLVTPNVRLVEPLARGGMGVVWIAEHLGLESRVAAKFIASEAAARDPLLVRRFQREASVAARLSSPHVVRVFDHGSMDDGTPYMVMELLEGETLASLLQRVGRIPARKAAAIVSQVAGVLERAHALGIVHRDLKPANIFLLAAEYDVFVKLLDFGVAKDARAIEPSRGRDCVLEAAPGTMTRTGAMLGTPWYMAPEQIVDAREVDHRADLWALAVVAYHGLTGERPFRGDSIGELASAMHAGVFAPPSRIDGVAPALDRWFSRALSVTPGDRFASAMELARTFSSAAGLGSGELTRPEPAARTGGSSGPPTSGGAHLEDPERSLGSTADGNARPSPQRSRRALWPLLLAPVAAGIALAAGSREARLAAPGEDHAGMPSSAASAATTHLSPVDAPHPAPPAPVLGASAAEPAATADGGVAPASVRRARRAPMARQPGKPTGAGASAAALPRPAYCATDEAYLVDEQGHLRPRPECL